MPRPTHIRVARLGTLLGRDPSTCNRRAHAGTYGRVTRDDEGRLQVAIAEIEAHEGRVFDDAEIARAVNTPSHNSGHVAAKAERLSAIDPGLIEIRSGLAAIFTPQEVVELVSKYIDERDMQWQRAIARANNLTYSR
jgi:hypothetical protein